MSDEVKTVDDSTHTTPLTEKPFKDGPDSVTSGYVGWLTESEEKTLNDMKDALTADSYEWEDDYELLRFLRARKFVLDDAVKMIKKFKDWYKEHNVGRYPEEFPLKAAPLGEIVPSAYHGFDRMGHPVQIERSGRIDVTTIISSVSDSEIVLGWVWGQQMQIRRCKQSAERRGLPVGSIERFTQVLDLDGMTLGHRDMTKFVNIITKYGEAYFPERLAYTLIVNPPFIFNVLYNLVKLTLDPVTREKVILIHNWDELHKYIEPEQLPQRYGGTLPDTDFPQLNDPDVEYLRQKYITDASFVDLYNNITIQKGETHVESVDVVPGVEYSYCFRSNEDVLFKAIFWPEGADRANEDEAIIVSNEVKTEASKWPILGSFAVSNEKSGVMELTWKNDNWWGAKDIKFAKKQAPITAAEAIKVDLNAVIHQGHVDSSEAKNEVE